MAVSRRLGYGALAVAAACTVAGIGLCLAVGSPTPLVVLLIAASLSGIPAIITGLRGRSALYRYERAARERVHGLTDGIIFGLVASLPLVAFGVLMVLFPILLVLAVILG